MRREGSADALLFGGDAIGRGGMSREFDDDALDALEVVIPNLNWRYSGGTAVNRTIAPLIAKRWRAAWFGPDRPEGIAGLSLTIFCACASVLRAMARSASGTRAAMSRCWLGFSSTCSATALR